VSSPEESYFKVLKKEQFPNDMLFLCYNFYKYYHNKPLSYNELFEYSKIMEMESLMELYTKRLGELK